jgi:hypothetical protein
MAKEQAEITVTTGYGTDTGPLIHERPHNPSLAKAGVSLEQLPPHHPIPSRLSSATPSLMRRVNFSRSWLPGALSTGFSSLVQTLATRILQSLSEQLRACIAFLHPASGLLHCLRHTRAHSLHSIPSHPLDASSPADPFVTCSTRPAQTLPRPPSPPPKECQYVGDPA